MNLPFFKKKTASSAPAREYFFALEISHFTVKSAVWSVINDKTQVLAVSSPAAWDNTSEDSLLTAADQVLSDATTRLDPKGKISPEKVIFGLPSDWLSQEKILPDQLKLLRALSKKLSLKAVGFVITPDAAVRFLQHSEGVPPTAILIGFWSDQIEVTLVRLGKIDGVQLVKRSSKVIADVVEGLTRFSHVDMFPSRMLLYDSGLDLEDIKQQLLAHPWQAPQTHLTFLHFPKIETLPGDFTIRAVATAGGTEVARAIGLIPETPPEEPSPASPVSPPASREDLGFVAETDVALLPQASPPPPLPPPPAPETAEPTPTPTEPPSEFIPYPHSRRRFSFPKFHFTALPIILLIIALLAGLFAAYWYLPRATVTLSLVPKSLDSQFDLTVDTQIQQINQDNRVIPGVFKEVNSSADKSGPATGTKLVGDKATGSVTIINGTGFPRTFAAGTTISSPSGLGFTLDTDVQVASASGTADPNSYQPGKATVKITSSQIGSDSNLTAGTQFRIGTFSSLDYVAKNDAAFVGGTSRQVKVVSKDDITKLRSDLTSSLKDSVKNQLLSQISSDEEVIPDTVSTQTVSEDLNHQEGDQSDSVTLRLTVKARGLTFKKSDLSAVINHQTQSQIPEGYVNISDFQHTFAVKKTDKNFVTLAVQISGSLLPRIAEKDVINHLVGKTPKSAYAYLSKLSGVAHVDIAFNLPLPNFLLTLPHTSSHISLSIQSQ